jgi:hypothetical protein
MATSATHMDKVVFVIFLLPSDFFPPKEKTNSKNKLIEITVTEVPLQRL